MYLSFLRSPLENQKPGLSRVCTLLALKLPTVVDYYRFVAVGRLSVSPKNVFGLRKMDNVFLSPHNSNGSPLVFDKVDEKSINNIFLGLDI